MPKKVTCNLENKQEFKFEDPCAILYSINTGDAATHAHFVALIEHMQYKSFGCHTVGVIFNRLGDELKAVGFKYKVSISVEDPTLQSAF